MQIPDWSAANGTSALEGTTGKNLKSLVDFATRIAKEAIRLKTQTENDQELTKYNAEKHVALARVSNSDGQVMPRENLIPRVLNRTEIG
jgi:hypothetical protein